MLQTCSTIRGSFTANTLIKSTRHVHSGTMDPLQLKPLMQAEGAPEKLISAIRRRNAPAVWKNYMKLNESGKLKKLPIQYHSMALQSLQLKDNGYYSSDQLKLYRKCALDIVEAAKKNSYQLDTRDHNLLLQLHGRLRDWNSATECWNAIQGAKNEESYNLYMKAAVESGQYDQVYKLFDKMKQEGVQTDVNTYNILIEVNGRMGNITEADKLFKDHFTAKPTEKSLSMIEKFLNKGPAPSVYTSSAAPLSRCIPSFSVTWTPTANTFEALIEAHGRKGNAPGLHYIHKTMLPQYNVNMDLKMYDTLIRWYCHVGDIEAARNTFVDMETNKVKPTVSVFYHLFRHEALKKNRPKVAEAILDYMRKDYGIRPPASMYTTLIKIHMRHNREDEANRLAEAYKELKSNRK